MKSLNDIDALIIDMDGVLWHGNRPQRGLEVFFAGLRQRDIPFVLATNNASHTPAEYVAKLAGFGVEVAPQEILTSGTATAFYLSRRYVAEQTRLFVIGSSGLIEPLQERGFILTELYEPDVDLVVCGLDRELSWDKLASACYALQAGAGLIASNGDTSLPTEYGFAPGNGAVLAAITAATNHKPLIIGKPEPILYQQAMRILGSSRERTVALGDRLDTDILGAVRAGIRSIFLLSGISTRSDLYGLPYEPTWIYNDILAVHAAMASLRR